MKNIFLLCFLVAFSAQQIHAFSFINQSPADRTVKSFHDSSEKPGMHVSELLPKNHLLASVQSDESEDDDEKNNESILSSSFNQKFAEYHHLYGDILISRYQQFATSVYKQSEVPYFILFSSWKLHLS